MVVVRGKWCDGGLKPTLHGVLHQGGGAGEVVLVVGGRSPYVSCCVMVVRGKWCWWWAEAHPWVTETRIYKALE